MWMRIKFPEGLDIERAGGDSFLYFDCGNEEQSFGFLLCKAEDGKIQGIALACQEEDYTFFLTAPDLRGIIEEILQ